MYKSRVRTTAKAALYLLPAMVILIVFKIYPIIRSFLMSFYTKYNYFTDVVSRYGLDNYTYIFRDPEFWRSMGNTLLFVVGVVPVSIVLSLLIACLLNQKIRFRALFRTIFFCRLSPQWWQSPSSGAGSFTRSMA
ncbi:carbohydrate ABC transporter permease [Ethanoligenens sp.]|uniref:carbohydrate ABC transporter permease n=1 Tax=Ethanoligenens sp. TaxID=2099655 RepID=UPI0039E86D7D